MKRTVITILFILSLAVSYGLGSIGFFSINTFSSQKISEDKLWNEIQSWRNDIGKPKYKNSDTLCEFASSRLNDVERNFSHEGFLETNATKYRLNSAENLAKDWPNEKAVLESFIRSPKHLENLIADYQYACVKTDGNVVVLLFAD